MSSNHLVALIHAGEHRRAPFEAACAARDVDAEVVTYFEQGLSKTYERAALRCAEAGKGVVLPELLKRCSPQRDVGDYEHVWMGCFSAGYGVPKRFDGASIAMLSGLVLLDSGYADKDPDGSALDQGVEWLLPWAVAARHGEKSLWVCHTLNDPGSYASTGKVAAEVVRLSGGQLREEAPPRGCRRRRAEGRFVVEEWPTSHGAAIADWGPDAMARAIAASA